MRAMRRYLPLSAAALLCLAARAQAQEVQTSLALSGGASTDQRGIRSGAATIAPSLLLVPDPRLSFTLSGSATRFKSDDWAVSGGTGVGTRLPLGRFLALAGSASGSAITTSYGARYVTLDGTSTLEATAGPVTVFGGAHVAQGRVTLPGASGTTALPLGSAPRPAAGGGATTRAASGPVYGAVLALPGAHPGAGGALTAREERMRVEGLTVIDRALGLGWSVGAHSVGATVGTRSAPDERSTHGEVRGALGIRPGIALQGALGRYPSSRTLATPGGRFATLGILLHRVDRGASSARQAAGLPPAPRGTTRLVLRAPRAQRVEVAGDWNGWAATPATRAGDGRWFADVRLPRGEYRYAFRVDGGRWTVPDGAPALDDGFGGRSALLTVP